MGETHTVVRPATQWPRVVLAAARLSGLYAAGVGVMLIPFMLFPGGGVPALGGLVRLSALPAILFVVAFLVLGLTRYAGLVVLWLVLSCLWALVVVAHERPIELMIGFVGWTALALPLCVMGALGVRTALRVRVGRASVGVPAVATILWATVLVPPVAVLCSSSMVPFPLEEVAAYRTADSIGLMVWGPAPFVLATLSLAHLWAGVAGGRRGARRVRRITTALPIALGTVVLATATGRSERRTTARSPVIESVAASAFHIRVFAPSNSVHRAMPCFQVREADSTEYAAFPDGGRSPCHVAGLQTRRPRDDGAVRMYGSW